jgi:hypothetical protein
MPVFSLFLSARTENVEAIHIPKNTIWLARIKCTSCNQNFPKEVGITLEEQVEMDKQHGSANFGAKCKNCDRKGYIAILNTSKYEARPDEDGLVKEALANFECRGLEILEVVMGEYFNVSVKGSNTVFDNADFTDLWCEYDENISAVAQVEDPKLDVVRSKDK